ncbi:fibrous sheath-interacting protein 1 isoform X2 [Syngnathus typhle]|uniref:fibrous sheath-interacting protein 1 isoform X2 n=1 Tax=Syngnathus typhle TaxID=161592 RepID=UPI002A69CF36|nr:fibrous sheath-interacting protein 1 isoform X2 [Syngnathus typhle]
MEMEIGVQDGSESISRPASRESSETTRRSQYDINATDEEKQDPKLQKAIEEMKRLDELLSVCMCREKEAKRQRRQCQAKLWQELKDILLEGQSENSHEAMNARLFWALEAPIGAPEKEIESLFQTQIGEERADDFSELSESVCEDSDNGSHSDADKGKKRQRNFVKRNIELVRGKGGQLLLTQAEEERLAELLRDIDEEEEKSARGSDNKERVSDTGVKHDGDIQPGEKVLQDTKERRMQEKQLLEIQRQLDLLGQDQEMTSEPERLSEEQLLCLLDRCELTETEPEP